MSHALNTQAILVMYMYSLLNSVLEAAIFLKQGMSREEQWLGLIQRPDGHHNCSNYSNLQTTPEALLFLHVN